MEDLAIALGLGLATGILVVGADRMPLLGWVCLAPLCAAVYLSPPLVAGAAAFVGISVAASFIVRGLFPFARVFEVVIILSSALIWAITSALAAWVWPPDAPLAGLLIWPAAMVGLTATISLPNAGRIVNPLLMSQVDVLGIVHISRLGNELVVPALFGLSGAVIATPFLGVSLSSATIAALAISGSVVAGAVLFGSLDARNRRAAIAGAPRVRVAAVASNPVVAAGMDYLTDDDDRRDIAGLIEIYGPLVEQATGQGARLVVLPEVGAWVTESNRQKWIGALQAWAQEHSVWLVSGIFELDQPVNRLVVVDPEGDLAASYDKQHPMQGAEPKRNAKMPPANLPGPEGELSAMICLDLDYPDMTRAVARHGGLLAVPANDWREVQEMHHRAAIWGAVVSGATVVRATTHGVSAVIDAAGRVLTRASSFDGPAVVVADAPILPPNRAVWRRWNWPGVAAMAVLIGFLLRML
jgi:predicted amidohydrolase